MTAIITLGADPEYGILGPDGRLTPPGNICRNLTDAFGVDGCSSIGELRPQYSDSPGGLTETIRKVLFRGISDNPVLLDYKMKAGGYVGDNAIGGHIHFGHAKLRHNDDAMHKLNTALNRTLAVLVMMVEDRGEAFNRRIGTGYGSIEDRAYNPQDWGMEYRVLPSWLTHPKECEAILATAFIIASEFLDEETMDEACSIPGYNTQAFRECDKIQLMYHIPPIVKFLRSLPLYEKYKTEVNYLFRMIKNREVWSCDANMIDSWGLREEVKQALAKKKEKSLV